MKQLPAKKSRLLRTTTENEEHAMDQNNGREAKVSKEETRTTLTMDVREIPPQVIKIPHPDQTSHMGTTIRKMEDPMIFTQIIHSLGATQIDLEMDLSTVRIEIGETLEFFLVFHRLKGETSHKIFHTANQEVINLTILLSGDLKINLRLVLHVTNNNFPQNTKQTPFNVDRFTTTDNSFIELSDFCPLNY